MSQEKEFTQTDPATTQELLEMAENHLIQARLDLEQTREEFHVWNPRHSKILAAQENVAEIQRGIAILKDQMRNSRGK